MSITPRWAPPRVTPTTNLGFAIGAGIKLNAPMIGQGDYLQAQVNYTQGALRYVFQTPNSNWGKVDGSGRGFRRRDRRNLWRHYPAHGSQHGDTAQSNHGLECQRGLRALLEPRWRTSLYGGYAAVSYNSESNAILCVDGGCRL